MAAFIITTLAVCCGILLAMAIGCLIFMHPKVIGWMVGYTNKVTATFLDDINEEEDEEL